MAQIDFVIGGARSGKSHYAENLLQQSDKHLFYMATGVAFDDEMRARIALHQQRRDTRWTTIDASYDLAAQLRKISAPQHGILVDCLSVWLSNHLLRQDDLAQLRQELLQTLDEIQGYVVLVASETGFGIVPENALARQFRDENGLLNQQIAARADHVTLIAAGLPLVLK